MKTSKLLVAFALASLVVGFATPAFAQEDQQYLPDVENLVGEAVELGAHLTWDAVTGADMYTVYYGNTSVQDDGGMYESDVIVENATEYTVTNLIPGTTYYFAVAAEDSTGIYLGSYSYSNEVSAIPLVAGPIDATEEETTTPDTTTIEEETTPDLPAAEEEELIEEEVDLTPITEESLTTDFPEENAAIGLEAEECEFGICEEPTQALPQSGPGLAVVLAASGLGGIFLRRKRK